MHKHTHVSNRSEKGQSAMTVCETLFAHRWLTGLSLCRAALANHRSGNLFCLRVNWRWICSKEPLWNVKCLLCCVCMGEEKLTPPSLRCIQYGHCAGNNKSKSLKIAWRYRKWWSHQEHVCCKWNGKCLKLQFVHVTNQLNKKQTPKCCKAVK